jgi:NAD(P)-dependent dehydrogenase (short-subunit alcohol dehydrogenase family)
MFTRELSKRLQGTNVTVNCLHPGLIDTGIWRNVNFFLKPGLFVLNKLMFVSVEQGAKTSVYLATSKDVEGVSGKYYKDCREGTLRSHVSDDERCLQLWERSLEFIKLQDSEPKI